MTTVKFTYLNISQMAVDIQHILDQYNRHWMDKKFKAQYDKVYREAQKLELMASKMSEVKHGR